jgi:hypothetical protein
LDSTLPPEEKELDQKAHGDDRERGWRRWSQNLSISSFQKL